MITDEHTQLLQQYVSTAQTILVFFAPQATVDQVAAAGAMYLGLQQLHKNVSLLSPLSPRPDISTLPGISRTTNQVGNKQLQVEFPYTPEMIDKVSYHIDESAQKFCLVIQPKKGAAPLDSSQVEYLYTGVDADLVIVVGARTLSDLGDLYDAAPELYETTPVVSIQSYETEFGTIKLSTAGSASASEAVAYLLQTLGVDIRDDIATALLAGIESGTDGFRSLVASADTFEIVSKLLRAGGQRLQRQKTESRNTSNGFASMLAQRNQKLPTLPRFEEARLEEERGTLTANTSFSSSDAPLEDEALPLKKARKKKIEPPMTPTMEGGSRS